MSAPGGPLKILVVGGGGREHALCWKIAQSPFCERIFCAPGNGGTACEDRVTNVPVPAHQVDRLIEICGMESIDLVVVGPDNPLAEGIVDRMEAAGLRVFGPRQASARLEWSKSYAKEFMRSAGLPTARFAVCDSQGEAEAAIRANSWARVVKVDGLALGKGVFVCDSEESALAAIDEVFGQRRFGDAGKRVVIEERLTGEELSLLLLCDGRTLLPLLPSQDHKRRFDGDRGPNTGGMGAYAPVGFYASCANQIDRLVLEPLRRAIESSALRYKGVLYVGLMLSPGAGASLTPHVLEFNCRFGDPETQAILPLMESDLVPLLWSCTDESLADCTISWRDGAACCVIAAASTYPDAPSRGEPIEIGGMPDDTFVFHGGTGRLGQTWVTDGGRVLAVTAIGAELPDARRKAYLGLERIKFQGMDFRTDIGMRGMEAQCR